MPERRERGSCSTARSSVGEQLLAALRAAPGVRASRARRLGAADDRQRQGPRRDRDRDGSARAGAGRGGARPDRVGRHAGEAGVRMRTHTGLPGRPEDRRARSVRQPAPALHRLQGAQHGAARRRRPQGPARVRVRRARRRDRRDPPVRDRGRRSTRCWASSTSSPSCARTAASSRRRPRGRCPS